MVAGHELAVADGQEGGRVAGLAVAVDDQARIVRQDGRRIEHAGESTRDLPGPDVAGDVPPQGEPIETQVLELARNPAAGVVADQQRAGRPLIVDELPGRGLVGCQQRLRLYPA